MLIRCIFLAMALTSGAAHGGSSKSDDWQYEVRETKTAAEPRTIKVLIGEFGRLAGAERSATIQDMNGNRSDPLSHLTVEVGVYTWKGGGCVAGDHRATREVVLDSGCKVSGACWASGVKILAGEPCSVKDELITVTRLEK